MEASFFFVLKSLMIAVIRRTLCDFFYFEQRLSPRGAWFVARRCGPQGPYSCLLSLFLPSSSIFSRPYREAGRFSLQINHVPISDKTMCVANSCEISYHRDAKWVFSFEGPRCTRLIYILRYCPKFGPAPLPLCDAIGWEKSQLYSWEMFRNVRNDDPRSTTDV